MTAISLPLSDARRRVRAEQLALLLLSLAAVFPYLSTLSFGYVYDDVGVIDDIVAKQGWSGLWRAWIQSYWGNPDTGLYRPVTQFFNSLFWNLGGGHAAVLHGWAVALHLVAVLAVWQLLRRATAAWIAFLAALLFAVHPLHVEAVANIANASEVLVAVLVLAMLFVLRRGDESTDASATIGWRIALPAALLYLLALGAKESAAGAPAIAFVVLWGWRAVGDDAAPGVAATLRRGWRVWSACVAALGVMLVARFLVLHGLTVRGDWIASELRGVSAHDRVWTMIAAWPLVVKLLYWPTQLRMHYGQDAVPLQAGASARALLALAGAGAGAAAAIFLARRGDRRPCVALAWIALAFLPASNLLVPTGQVLAERTLYLPSVGAMMLAAWLLDRLASRFERNAPNRALRGLVAASALGIAWIGASRTLSQTVLWQDNFTLFQSGIAAAPSSARPLWLMGNLHISRGDVRKGLVYLARAHRLDPADPAVVYYYTRALHDVGNHELELAVLRDARRRITGSQSEQIRVMYRIALSQSRGPDSVIADVRADPSTDSVALHWKAVFLTEAFERKGMPDSALAAYRSALALQPGDGFLHFLYAKLLHDRGLDAQAASQLALAEAYPGGTKPESLARLRTEIESRRGQRTK